jgi:hypothetical protein
MKDWYYITIIKIDKWMDKNMDEIALTLLSMVAIFVAMELLS